MPPKTFQSGGVKPSLLGKLLLLLGKWPNPTITRVTITMSMNLDLPNQNKENVCLMAFIVQRVGVKAKGEMATLYIHSQKMRNFAVSGYILFRLAG